MPPCLPLSFASRAPFMLILLLCLSSFFVVDILYLMAATDLAILSYDRQSVLCMFHSIIMCAHMCRTMSLYVVSVYGVLYDITLWRCSVVVLYGVILLCCYMVVLCPGDLCWCSVMVIYGGAVLVRQCSGNRALVLSVLG